MSRALCVCVCFAEKSLHVSAENFFCLCGSHACLYRSSPSRLAHSPFLVAMLGRGESGRMTLQVLGHSILPLDNTR